jgi:hypothetical protein
MFVVKQIGQRICKKKINLTWRGINHSPLRALLIAHYDKVATLSHVSRFGFVESESEFFAKQISFFFLVHRSTVSQAEEGKVRRR